MFKNKRGFTLIELLIVVAIIAILAAIAIPNFLMAQVRAKVSRVKAELRTLTTALEAYYTDENAYPRWREVAYSAPPPGQAFPSVSQRFIPLTTPIAYITSVPKPDPFQTNRDIDGLSDPKIYDTYDYLDMQSSVEYPPIGTSHPNIGTSLYGRVWRMSSAGPDRLQSYGGSVFTGPVTNPTLVTLGFYDPTNGTVSNGDIIRLGGKSSYYAGYDVGYDQN